MREPSGAVDGWERTLADVGAVVHFVTCRCSRRSIDAAARLGDGRGVAWSDHELDGGLLRFDRETGVNVLLRGPRTHHLERRAPRSLQIGLLTPSTR